MAMRRKILARLRRLRPGVTMCPGQLARDCGTVLKTIRTELQTLAGDGQIVMTQGGETVSADAIKGPFRVRLKD
jgi:hypothetical protein